MNEFRIALQEKISDLECRRTELEETFANLDSKLEVLRELLSDEKFSPVNKAPAAEPKKRGRPPKKIVELTVNAGGDEALLNEARAMEGTDPELAARLSTRPFNPTARPPVSRGPGIRVGTGRTPGEHADNKGHVQITVEDETT